jgi:hypothetical protein
MERIYRNDAYRLAIQRVNNINSPWKDSVEIPEIYVDSIAKIFYTIHNMDWSRTKDTILTLSGQPIFYGMDSTHYSSINNAWHENKVITIGVSSTASFANDWSTGNYRNTSNTDINYLVSRYNFTVAKSFTYQGTTWYHVISPRMINVQALIKQFAVVNGVTNAELNSYVGDGNSLTTIWQDDIVNLTYRLGCGDCPSGCIYGRLWRFNSNLTTCSVQYLSAANWGGGIGQIIYGLPYTCMGTIVPLGLSASGYIKNGQALVEWKAGSEQSITRYEIERSADAVHFSSVGAVPVLSASGAPKTYSWSDNLLLATTFYYRIKSINKDGTATHSNVVKLSSSKGVEFIIYPNPVYGNKINLQVANAAGNYTLTIYDMQGRRMFAQQLSIPSASFAGDIQLPASLSKGSYRVLLQNNTTQLQQLLMLQ